MSQLPSIQQRSELVRIKTPPDGAKLARAGLNTSPIGVLASYPLDSIEGRTRAAHLLNAKTVSLQELRSGVFNCISITAEPCEWEDEQGELVQTLRVVFETDAPGGLIQTHACSAADCLARLIWACPLPWGHPITIHFESGLSNRKRPIYRLWHDPHDDVVVESPPPDRPRKK